MGKFFRLYLYRPVWRLFFYSRWNSTTAFFVPLAFEALVLDFSRCTPDTGATLITLFRALPENELLRWNSDPLHPMPAFLFGMGEVYTESVLSKRKVYLNMQKDFATFIPQDTMLFFLSVET